MDVENLDPAAVADGVSSWVEHLIQWLVMMVDQLGLAGIFVMTFLESTFMPIPSEITMLPAGYLVQQGQMSLAGVLFASVLGTIGGAYFNYWLAKHFGRGLFLRYGKYFFLKPEKLEKLELFFARHGAISTFTGRLIPGLRHMISFPAGLARMNLRTFIIYTGLGGTIWMSTLLALGYYIGKNQELAVQYLPKVKIGIVLFIVVLFTAYLVRNARRKKREAALKDISH